MGFLASVKGMKQQHNKLALCLTNSVKRFADTHPTIYIIQYLYFVSQNNKQKTKLSITITYLSLQSLFDHLLNLDSFNFINTMNIFNFSYILSYLCLFYSMVCPPYAFLVLFILKHKPVCFVCHVEAYITRRLFHWIFLL